MITDNQRRKPTREPYCGTSSLVGRVTDNQRREVAKRLRKLDVSDIEVDGCIIDSPKYVGLLLMRMLDAACDYRDGLHHFPGFFSARAVVELFTDLIDPEGENDD